MPIILLVIINLLTVFTPEIGFDSLWYHLTLPKLWLLKHQWYFDGGLLYYSVMPRLTETLFIPLIKYFDFMGPKLLLYISGIGTSIIVWKLIKKLSLSTMSQILGVSLFYCTWLVSWQSGSSYIDLFRTFLEIIALWFLVSGSWVKGGIFLGLSIGTKWLSLGSLAIYAVVFGLPLTLPAFLLAAPWAAIALAYTGNPFYPLFDTILHNSFAPIFQIIKRVFFLPLTLTIPFDDFLSPMVFILIIFSFLSLFNNDKRIRQISAIGILGAIFSVSLEPPSSRYFLPFFPAIIIAALATVDQLKPVFQRYFIFLCILSSFLVLGMRVVANIKYIPYLSGKQNINTFLTDISYRLPDTFIDSDNFVKNEIPKNSKILIDKIHNLYYFPYDFDHTSWANADTQYEYLITKDSDPQKTKGELIHTNPIGIQIYKLK